MANFKFTYINNSSKQNNYGIYKDSRQTSFTYVMSVSEEVTYAKKPKIDYISVLPGVGKTHWAIQKMVKSIKYKKHIYLFVAPTTALLDEVDSRIREACERKNVITTKIHKIHGADRPKQDKYDASDLLSVVFLNTLKEAKRGEIFLITHALFFSLKDIPQKENIVCIIDEATSIEVEDLELRLNDEAMQSLNKHLSFEILPKHALTRSNRLEIHPHQIEDYFKVTSKQSSNYKKDATNVYHENYHKLIEGIKDKKIDAYMMKSGSSYTFYTFPCESNYFQGFHQVILMGAGLEERPIYHILNKNHKLRNIPINPEREQEILRRLSQLTIKPILKHLTRDGKQDGYLSKTLLANSVVYKPGKSDEEDIKAVLTKAYDALSHPRPSRDDFIQCLRHSEKCNNTKSKHVIDQMRKKHKDTLHDPFDYLLTTACQDIAPRTNVLVVVNKKYQQAYCSDEYGVNITAMTNHLQGLNCFKKDNTIIFLAALRYTPSLTKFYQSFIPNYDVQHNLLVSNIIQAVFRLNIRDIKSTKKAYLYVASEQTADLMQALFYRRYNKKIFRITKPLDKKSYAVTAQDMITVKKQPKKTKQYTYIDKYGKLISTTRAQDVFNNDPEYKNLNNQKTQKNRELTAFNGHKGSEKYKTLVAQHAKILQKMKARKIEMNLPGYNPR